MKHSLPVWLCTLALTGCMAGPNYKRPEVEVPSAWHNVLEPSAGPGPAEASSAWWKVFRDPALDSLIERALQANLQLKFAEARIREAHALRGVASAPLWPTLGANAAYTRLHFSQNAFNLNSSNPTALAPPQTNISFLQESNLYQAGFDSTWELDFFGGTRRNMEAASADLDSACEQRHALVVSLLADVGRAYIQLRSLQAQILISRANLKAQQETLDLTRDRQKMEVASGLDVARADAQVASTAAVIPALETGVRQSIHQLSVLLGQEPSALSAELSPVATLDLPTQTVLAGMPSELLVRRPDIRRAERDLAAATARIGVAKADLFPKFSLTNALGLESAQLTNFLKGPSTFWALSPGFVAPIFQGGRIRQNIRAQEARAEESLLNYKTAVLNALQEGEDALAAYNQERQRLESLKRQVAANRTAVELSTQLYANGVLDFLSVLDAQRSQYAAELARAQSTQAVATDIVAIYKALGGGWEVGDAQSQPSETKPAPQ